MSEAGLGGYWESEQLVLCRDDSVGLRAVIAIDDTTLGPGLGGVRCVTYPDDVAAVAEARRLAAAMTLKNAFAGLPYGGAKSVILKPAPGGDREALMRRFGEFVMRAGGAYLPGVDMGTSTVDLTLIGESGAAVSCSEEDPSPWTALGVAAAVRATAAHLEGRTRLDGLRVLIQGAGHVGAVLAGDLAEDGAEILIADVDEARADAVARAVGGHTVPASEVLGTECDVFAPCAVARVVSAETVPMLRCRAIVGAANDTLATEGDADLLAARGITYVPDFVANAGGVIHIHALRGGHDLQRLRDDVQRIGSRVSELLTEADELHSSPLTIAVTRVRRLLAHARAGATDQREVLRT